MEELFGGALGPRDAKYLFLLSPRTTVGNPKKRLGQLAGLAGSERHCRRHSSCLDFKLDIDCETQAVDGSGGWVERQIVRIKITYIPPVWCSADVKLYPIAIGYPGGIRRTCMQTACSMPANNDAKGYSTYHLSVWSPENNERGR